MKKYVVLFSLETNEYLFDTDETGKDWRKAYKFNDEEIALSYLSLMGMGKPKLKYWCTRTFYELN